MSVFDKVAGLARYIWPLRVPLIAGLVLAGLPLVSFRGSAEAFLSGLFDPISDWAFVAIGTIALFDAWAIAVVFRLVVTHGTARLGLPDQRRPFFPIPKGFWVLSGLLAVPTVTSAVVFASTTGGAERIPTRLLLLAVGFAIAVTALAIAVIGSDKIDAFEKAIDPAAGGLKGAYLAFLRWLRDTPSIGEGFVEGTPEAPRLARGHGLALALGTASVAIYVATGFVTRDQQRPEFASTLTYVLLLNLVLTWFVGFAAFLLDRSRVPLVAYLVLWAVVVSYGVDRVFSTDHIYRTVDMPKAVPPLAAAADLLRGSDPVVLIAASGGGIQAAAWTARVVTGLEDVDGFRQRLRLISAVSGGSVGTMNALAAWPGCGPATPPGAPAFDPNRASQESSLHAVGWGLVFKDLPRTVVPFFSNPYVDRGSVLEDVWKREARLRKPFPDPSPLLSTWRANVAERLCPAVIYNAMVAETGQPMLFGTTALPDRLKPFDFHSHYKNRDVPVTTAVRLSAGFPFVSPATRADVDDDSAKPTYSHVVDGGYFDNYGIDSLAMWTHEGLSALEPAQRPPRVLIIEICDSAPCSSREADPAPAAGGPRRAWPYQAYAPLEGVIAMRTAAQKVHNRATLRLLTAYWRTQRVCVESQQIAFDGSDAPMSWHLTRGQRTAIQSAWDGRARQERERLADFLAGRLPCAQPPCAPCGPPPGP